MSKNTSKKHKDPFWLSNLGVVLIVVIVAGFTLLVGFIPSWATNINSKISSGLTSRFFKLNAESTLASFDSSP